MKKLLFAALIFASCENVKLVTNTPVTPTIPATPAAPPAFDIQGHRGTRGLMPENTIPAFIKALDLGVNTLEMDAAITKDDKVVISHDPYFSHDIALKPDGKAIEQTEEKNIGIYKMNYDEVEKYDVGSKGNKWYPEQRKIKTPKPLLSDVIDSAETHASMSGRALPFYNIEIKSLPAFDNVYYPNVEKYTDLVMAVVMQKNIAARVIIQSFDIRALKYMHQKYPAIRLALNANADDKKSFADRIAELGFSPNVFSPNMEMVDTQLVQDCTAKGIKIIPYTVNEVADMKRLKALGVSGFMTDYPNRTKGL